MTPLITQLKSNFFDVIDEGAGAEVQALAGELSARKYYRILVKKPSEDRLTPSYVLQAAESFEDPEKHPFLLAQQIFQKIGIRVPKIFGVAGQEGWILVEDCGDFFLQHRQELSLYRQAIDMLLSLQKCRAPLADMAEAPHWNWAFDVEKLNAEMLHTENFFVSALAKSDLPLAKLLLGNSQYLADRPRVLCHRDFHSRNLLVRDETLFALDFQDARMGPVSYDLVSLLWDPYADLKSGIREILLQEWRTGSDKTLLVGVEEEIHRMKIQRLLKAVGSYSSFFVHRGNPSCFVYVECALFDTLQSFEALKIEKRLSQDEIKVMKWLKKTYEAIAEK